MDRLDAEDHVVGVVRPDHTRQRIPLPVDARPVHRPPGPTFPGPTATSTR